MVVARKTTGAFIKALKEQNKKTTALLTFREHQKRVQEYKKRMQLQPSIASTSTSGAKTAVTPVEQRFDYFLVLDFEATCQEGSPLLPYQEIIEFPCAKLSSRTWEVESRFRHFVRPTANPELTTFCSHLTGVIQEMVDDQPPLADVLKKFDTWLHDEGLLPDGKFAFVTCGDWDLQLQLPKEASIKGIQLPDYLSKWINVKKAFAAHRGYFPAGMKHLLKELKLTHEGRLHSGLDDVENICSIVRALAADGHVFDYTGGEDLPPRRTFREWKQ